MKELKVYVHKKGGELETGVTVAFSVLHVAVRLLPKKIKAVLEREGIDLIKCKELVKEKDLKGTLIEIESPEEKLIISVE